MYAMGWRKFENFAAGFGLPPDEFARLVRKNGLRAVSSHDSLDMAGWRDVLNRAQALGQSYVGSGGVGQPGTGTLGDTLQSAANLEQLGEAAAKKGLKFFIHTHQREITTRYEVDLEGSGRKQSQRVIDILAAKTNPRFVNFEIDIGWAAAAFDLDQKATADFLRRHRNRIVLVHVKDMTASSMPTDLGVGVLDYSKLLEAAGSHITYYIWEYDHPPMPLQAAAIAYRYMTCGH
jgi:sugar phosphate isomerase/epimerase